MQELRYIRHIVDDLDTAATAVAETVGLMAEDRTETETHFRADHRHYALCLTTNMDAALGVSVSERADLDGLAARLETEGSTVTVFDTDAAQRRMVREGISVQMPCGVALEIVWRHLESGWPYHGPRDTGISGLGAVQLASTDPVADAQFLATFGLALTDRVGEATFHSLGDTHHQFAVYPSDRNGLLGAVWHVRSMDHIMRHWHWLQARQLPVVHGPGRQPTSGAAFVTTRAPDGLLHTYATEMGPPPKDGPRQFADAAASHCAWGSPTDQSEFSGGAR